MKGVKSACARILGLGPVLSNAAEQVIRQTTARSWADAVRLAPVETGQLRDSIATRISIGTARIEGSVFTECPYAAAVEFGSRGRPASPFLLPVAAQQRTEFPKTMVHAVKQG